MRRNLAKLFGVFLLAASLTVTASYVANPESQQNLLSLAKTKYKSWRDYGDPSIRQAGRKAEEEEYKARELAKKQAAAEVKKIKDLETDPEIAAAKKESRTAAETVKFDAPTPEEEIALEKRLDRAAAAQPVSNQPEQAAAEKRLQERLAKEAREAHQAAITATNEQDKNKALKEIAGLSLRQTNAQKPVISEEKYDQIVNQACGDSCVINKKSEIEYISLGTKKIKTENIGVNNYWGDYTPQATEVNCGGLGSPACQTGAKRCNTGLTPDKSGNCGRDPAYNSAAALAEAIRREAAANNGTILPDTIRNLVEFNPQAVPQLSQFTNQFCAGKTGVCVYSDTSQKFEAVDSNNARYKTAYLELAGADNRLSGNLDQACRKRYLTSFKGTLCNNDLLACGSAGKCELTKEGEKLVAAKTVSANIDTFDLNASILAPSSLTQNQELARSGCEKSKTVYRQNGGTWICWDSEAKIVSRAPDARYADPANKKLADALFADIADAMAPQVTIQNNDYGKQIKHETCDSKYILINHSCVDPKVAAFDENYSNGVMASNMKDNLFNNIPVIDWLVDHWLAPAAKAFSPSYYNSAKVQAEAAQAMLATRPEGVTGEQVLSSISSSGRVKLTTMTVKVFEWHKDKSAGENLSEYVGDYAYNALGGASLFTSAWTENSFAGEGESAFENYAKAYSQAEGTYIQRIFNPEGMSAASAFGGQIAFTAGDFLPVGTMSKALGFNKIQAAVEKSAIGRVGTGVMEIASAPLLLLTPTNVRPVEIFAHGWNLIKDGLAGRGGSEAATEAIEKTAGEGFAELAQKSVAETSSLIPDATIIVERDLDAAVNPDTVSRLVINGESIPISSFSEAETVLAERFDRTTTVNPNNGIPHFLEGTVDESSIKITIDDEIFTVKNAAEAEELIYNQTGRRATVDAETGAISLPEPPAAKTVGTVPTETPIRLRLRDTDGKTIPVDLPRGQTSVTVNGQEYLIRPNPNGSLWAVNANTGTPTRVPGTGSWRARITETWEQTINSSNLLAGLARQYPDEFDAAVGRLLAENIDDIDDAALIRALLDSDYPPHLINDDVLDRLDNAIRGGQPTAGGGAVEEIAEKAAAGAAREAGGKIGRYFSKTGNLKFITAASLLGTINLTLASLALYLRAIPLRLQATIPTLTPTQQVQTVTPEAQDQQFIITPTNTAVPPTETPQQKLYKNQVTLREASYDPIVQLAILFDEAVRSFETSDQPKTGEAFQQYVLEYIFSRLDYQFAESLKNNKEFMSNFGQMARLYDNVPDEAVSCIGGGIFFSGIPGSHIPQIDGFEFQLDPTGGNYFGIINAIDKYGGTGKQNFIDQFEKYQPTKNLKIGVGENIAYRFINDPNGKYKASDLLYPGDALFAGIHVRAILKIYEYEDQRLFVVAEANNPQNGITNGLPEIRLLTENELLEMYGGNLDKTIVLREMGPYKNPYDPFRDLLPGNFTPPAVPVAPEEILDALNFGEENSYGGG